MDQDAYDRLVDQALTAGGKGHAGSLDPDTLAKYARAFVEFETWCRSESQPRRRAMPATSETLAVYAASLLAGGYRPATVRLRLAGIRAWHRRRGEPVPDDVAAWHVLRATERTAASPQTNLADRSTLVAAVDTCDLDRTAGVRDRCLITLLWDLYAPAAGLVALDIEDLSVTDDEVRVPFRGGLRRLGHDHDPVQACPVEAAAAWLQRLAGCGLVSGPLFRPVDRLGTVAAAGVRYAGRLPAGCRLTVRGVAKIWASRVARAGVPMCTPHALRVGGARDDVSQGVGLPQVLRDGGWVAGSSVVTGWMSDVEEEHGGG